MAIRILRVILVLVGLTTMSSTPCAAEWTPIRLSIFFKTQLFSNRDVYGLDLGLLTAGSPEPGWSVGLQTALLETEQDNVVGISVAPVNAAKKVIGIQLGTANKANIRGIQFGAFNLRHNAGLFFTDPCPSQDSDVGIKIGLSNTAECGPMIGAEVGFYNDALTMIGLQVGFLNYARTLRGIQIGALNFIEQSGRGPGFLPIINASF